MTAELRRRSAHLALDADGAAALFGRLHHRWPHAAAALLDSSDHDQSGGGSDQRSRYSILAFSLGPDAESVQLDHGLWQWLDQAWQASLQPAASSLLAEASSSPEASSHPAASPQPTGSSGAGPPFQLGWIGWVGYELQGRFFRATHAVVIDHHHGVAELQSLGEDLAWERAVADELDHLRRTPAETPPAEGPDAAELAELRLRDARQDYLERIAAALEQIRCGTSYEVCLTTAVTGQLIGSAWQAYLRLRAQNRSPFTQYLHLPAATDDVVLLSTSPERFMQISKDRRLKSEPIKGTRARGVDAAEDVQLLEDLANHPKDRAENVMITDLVRNDLSIHAIPGSLRTERLCAIETYPTVHQMVSTLSAQLDPAASPTQALAAAFPPGSMTGAPKRSTMEILQRLETGPRGPYSGAAGYFSTTGACDLSVLIRTAVLRRCASQPPARHSASQPPADCSPAPPGAGPRWNFHLGLGGAITADSDPQQEWQEIITKSRGVLGALGAEFPSA